MDNYWLNALWSIVPTLLIGLVFWAVMRAIIRADRDERAAYADIEATERARLGCPPPRRRPQASLSSRSCLPPLGWQHLSR